MNGLMKKSAAVLLTAMLALGSTPAYVGVSAPSFAISASADSITDVSIGTWADLAYEVNRLSVGDVLNVNVTADLVAPANADTIVVPENALVKINLNNHKLNRNLSAAVNDGYVIKVSSFGELEIKNGTVTGGNNAYAEEGVEGEGVRQISGNGGGIVCESFGCLYLDNVIVSGNKAYNGAGVWIDTRNNKTEIMYGGSKVIDIKGSTIENNDAVNNGGGVYFTRSNGVKNSDYYFIENSTIRNNKAVNGGGVFAQTGPWVNVNSSTITRNEATENGGGYYSDNSFAVSLAESTISYNSAVNGGGMYLKNNADVRIVSESSVIDNSAAKGGGLYLDKASAKVGDRNFESYVESADGYGQILRNSATQAGGGVYVDENSTLSLQYGNVKQNTVSEGAFGAGIYNVGKVEIQNLGATVSDQTKKYKTVKVVDNTVPAQQDGKTFNIANNLFVTGSGKIDNSGLAMPATGYPVVIGVSTDDVGVYECLTNTHVVNTLLNDDAGYYFYEKSIIYDPIPLEFTFHDENESGNGMGITCAVYEFEGDLTTITAAKTNIGGTYYYAAKNGDDIVWQAGTSVGQDDPTSCIGNSAGISGDIGFKFTWNLSTGDAARLDELKTKFTWTVNGTTKTAQSDVVRSGSDYASVVSINPAEISSTITANLVDSSDTVIATADSSFSEYLRKLRGNPESSESLKNLTVAVLDYGTSLQKIFGINEDMYANTEVNDSIRPYGSFNNNFTTADYNTFTTGDFERNITNLNSFTATGMRYIGTSLLFLNKTTVRHYFEVEDGVTPPTMTLTLGTGSNSRTFTAGAKTASHDKWVYYDIPNVSIEDWGTECKIAMGTGSIYYYCPLDYSIGVFRNALQTDPSKKQDIEEDYIGLGKAMHYCYKYAAEYAGSNA